MSRNLVLYGHTSEDHRLPCRLLDRPRRAARLQQSLHNRDVHLHGRDEYSQHAVYALQTAWAFGASACNLP